MRYVGEKVRAVRAADGPAMREAGLDFNINLILGGQIGGQPPQIYRVYSPGNAIHASRESPFLQIGETKYGKPVLDRGFTFDKTLNEAVRYGILSLDATAKSNVSVGTPFEVFCYEADSLEVRRRAVLHDNDPWLRPHPRDVGRRSHRTRAGNALAAILSHEPDEQGAFSNRPALREDLRCDECRGCRRGRRGGRGCHRAESFSRLETLRRDRERA